jgi:predicted RNA binding protein YcfA (HicA-like mRNA interferase family)
MKCSELYRLLKKYGWYVVSQRGSHIKMKHDSIAEMIIFPDHRSREISKGLEKWIKKIAGINEKGNK